jgi:hypothetical protein
MKQADEMEIIRHIRKLAADRERGEEESAIGHGHENAAEAPRAYNDFQRTATTPLTLCLSPRVALHRPPPALTADFVQRLRLYLPCPCVTPHVRLPRQNFPLSD